MTDDLEQDARGNVKQPGGGRAVSDRRFIKPGFDQAVSHTVEEIGEVLAAIGKMQRHGPLSVNPLLPREEQETNIAWVWRELADLEAALGRLATEIRKRPDFGFLPFNPAAQSVDWPTIDQMRSPSPQTPQEKIDAD